MEMYLLGGMVRVGGQWLSSCLPPDQFMTLWA